jgi:DNA-binding NarL/FixJ family response regulator
MRVLLADDHLLLVEGLSNLLSANGIDVVGTAADGRQAVLQALALSPDLVLMDLRMPVCDGLTATRLIKAQRPDIEVVILTTSAEDQDLFAAVQSGACGYLLKSIGGNAFMEALDWLEEGIPPFSPGLANKLLGEFVRLSNHTPSPPVSEAQDPPAELTDRQTEILRLVASGMTYKEVGHELSLSERTVRYHMAEIMDRLHLEHRSQVIAYAGKIGLDGCT